MGGFQWEVQTPAAVGARAGSARQRGRGKWADSSRPKEVTHIRMGGVRGRVERAEVCRGIRAERKEKGVSMSHESRGRGSFSSVRVTHCTGRDTMCHCRRRRRRRRRHRLVNAANYGPRCYVMRSRCYSDCQLSLSLAQATAARVGGYSRVAWARSIALLRRRTECGHERKKLLKSSIIRRRAAHTCMCTCVALG